MLNDILRQDEYDGLTQTEALEHLQEIAEIKRDKTAYTWSGVNQQLAKMGVPIEVRSAWDTVVGTLPGGTMLDRMLSSGGVDFSLDDMQASLQHAIDGLDDQSETYEVTKSVLEALKAIGVLFGPRWRKFGLTEEPTLQGIEAAIEQNELLDLHQSMYNTHVASVLDSGNVTAEALIAGHQAVIAGLEG
jgi:hypothetical protein